MMSKSLNKVQLIGNLTKDVEVRDVNATHVAKFSLALNETWKDASGEYKESVEYADCEMWGKVAPVFEGLASKGTKVYVEGKYTQQTWEDKEGNSRKSTVFKINPSSWILLTNKDSQKVSGSQTEENTESEVEDEIPF